MFVTTHTLVATTVAVKTKKPWIYIPAAILNHFILDFMPHFGIPQIVNNKTFFIISIILDAVCAISLYFYFVKKNVFPAGQLFFIDFLAGWPDLLMVYQKYVNPQLLPNFLAFHVGIQHESPYGIIIEASIWAFCLAVIFAKNPLQKPLFDV